MKNLIALFFSLLNCLGITIAIPANTSFAKTGFPVTSERTLVRAVEFEKRYSQWLGNGNHLMEKIVDDNGNGAQGLAGNRNVRTVLHGVLYRGGTAESLNPNHDAKNTPLLQSSLENLCKEGFDRAVYLYEAELPSKPISCLRNGMDQHFLMYSSQVAVEVTKERQAIPNPTIIRQLLLATKMSIEGAIDSPVYVHCWSGRHASGFLAALALRQFCDFSGDEAVLYWVDGTDGAGNFPSFHEGIRNFVPYEDLKLDINSQNILCPKNPYHRANSN